MKSLFNYDSPIMQALTTVGDLIIINIMFLIFCIPIFTIGAAQSGLYNAVRVLQDKEDDSSCAAAFFRGFRNGFGRITAYWCIFLVVFYLLFANYALVYIYGQVQMDAPVVLAMIGLFLCAMIQTQLTIFHSRFDCTFRQLFRNAVLLVLAHPLRSLLATVVTWSPLILFLLDMYIFMMAAPLFFVIWFSTAFLFGYTFMKKPYEGLIDTFNTKTTAAAAEIQAKELEAAEEVSAN